MIEFLLLIIILVLAFLLYKEKQVYFRMPPGVMVTVKNENWQFYNIKDSTTYKPVFKHS